MLLSTDSISSDVCKPTRQKKAPHQPTPSINLVFQIRLCMQQVFEYFLMSVYSI